MKLKIVAVILVLAACVMCFSGCITGTEAKDFVDDFFAVVENGFYNYSGSYYDYGYSYGSISSYMHPNSEMDIIEFFNEIEYEEGVNFQNGIEVLKYSATAYSSYDGQTDASSYRLTAKVRVDGVTMKFVIKVGEDGQNGPLGIYSIKKK